MIQTKLFKIKKSLNFYYKNGLNITSFMYKVGDKVEYHAIGGAKVSSVGVIQDILFEPKEFHEHIVHATKDEPRYVIHNLHTEKDTPYKLSSIIKKVA